MEKGFQKIALPCPIFVFTLLGGKDDDGGIVLSFGENTHDCREFCTISFRIKFIIYHITQQTVFRVIPRIIYKSICLYNERIILKYSFDFRALHEFIILAVKNFIGCILQRKITNIKIDSMPCAINIDALQSTIRFDVFK